MSTQVVEISDGSIVVTTDVGLNGATKQALADEATARANADSAHAALTTAHGSTSANTASRIVQRSAAGVTSLSGLQLDTAAAPAEAIGLISWNDVDKTAQVVTEGGVVLQLGQEETVYVRNASGVALVNGDAVYVTGATGQRPTVAKATANSSTAQKMIGLVTTSGGIANNAFGFVTVAGIVRDLDTSAFTDGAELWLSPTVAGALTATQPSGEAQRIMRVGYVLRVHANQGQILVSTHYHGTPLANSLMESEGAAAGRTALGLGTLATQSGTFSGTSSGTNTGDQTASTVANTPAGNIAATTVQAALNELDSEKTTAAAALAAADAAIQSALTAYSPQGYLNSDGATADRAQIQGPFDAVNNPRGWVAGAATLTWRGVVTVPSATQAGFPNGPSIAYCQADSNAQPNNTTNSIYLYIPSNALIVGCRGTSQLNSREFTNATFRTTYSGQTILLEIVWTQGTANPVVRVNEVDVSTSFTLTTSGTPPAWLDAAMVPTYHLTGYNWPSGPAPVGCFILGALTDADRAFWRTTGQYPAWVAAGGSMKDAKPITGTLVKWFGTGTVSGGTATAVTFDAGSSGLYANGPALSGVTVQTGSKWIINLTVSGMTSSGTVGISNLSISAETTVVNGTADYIITAGTSGTNVIMSCTSTTAATFTINSISPLGALSLPGIQPCAVVDDLTTIGGNQARLVGVTPVTPKRDWRISADTWANGNQRILEGALIDSTADIIDTIEQITTGTPTTTIGSASAGAQYKASGALTAGINPTTLVTRKAASNEFWVGSNSTAVVRTTIKGHRAV